MSARLLKRTCYALLAVVWIVDVLTPQSLVVAILFNASIALSSAALDPVLTRRLVVLALVADLTAGIANGLAEHHWDAIGVGDRVLAAFSFFIVGGMSVATQRSAARAAELTSRAKRSEDEQRLRTAVESVRNSVNEELVERAIARAAAACFDAEVRVYVARDPSVIRGVFAPSGDAEIATSTQRPEPEIVSYVERLAYRETGAALAREIDGDDALGRLLLETLGRPYAASAALLDHHTSFGVVFVARDRPFEARALAALETFAEQSGVALARAALFAQLGERNEELARLGESLRERGDVIRDLVYALSHDLRTPLVAARMTLEQARDGAYGEPSPRYREILERSIASNEELQRLAETLLLVSRFESGDRSAMRAPVDVVSLARRVVRDLEPLWSGRGLATAVEADGSVVVEGDEHELYRALVNLVANAVAWTPAGGTVGVGVTADGRRARIVVEDDGYGVPEAVRADLFQRLARGANGAGSGLGLYLVRRIAEGHDGAITYEPRPGGGSHFALDLPASAAKKPE